MLIGQQLHHDVPAECKVVMTAVTADTPDLYRALIEVSRVDLISSGGGIVGRDRNVYGSVDSDIDVNDGSGKMSVSPVAGAIATGRDHVGAE